MARLFNASTALELGIAQYRKDPHLFVRCSSHPTPLEDCVYSRNLRAETCVVDPFQIYRGTALQNWRPLPLLKEFNVSSTLSIQLA